MQSDIMIWTNNIQQRNSAVLAALHHAKHVNGTVTALYEKLDKIELQRWQTNLLPNLVKDMLVDIDQQESVCRKVFEEFANKIDCKTAWLTVPKSGDSIQKMLCTDFIFIDQPIVGDHKNALGKSVLNRIILATKRPVMMVPNTLEKYHLPPKIVLGWNSSAESMRAVVAALPLMHLCEHVDIVCMINDRMSPAEKSSIYQIKDYLTHKGIENNLILESTEKQSQIPAKFLDYAIKSDANLIVAGGYGHSRLREIIVGGMTAYLIDHASIPVLFSH